MGLLECLKLIQSIIRRSVTREWVLMCKIRYPLQLQWIRNSSVAWVNRFEINTNCWKMYICRILNFLFFFCVVFFVAFVAIINLCELVSDDIHYFCCSYIFTNNTLGIYIYIYNNIGSRGTKLCYHNKNIYYYINCWIQRWRNILGFHNI